MSDLIKSYEQFLANVFPKSELRGDDTVVVCPSKFGAEDAYAEGVTERLRLGKQAVYLMVSTAAPRNKEGRLRRRQVDCREAFVFVLDDIGTKSRRPNVEPSYKIRTSWKPNADGELIVSNEQWGYLIEAYDVSTPAGAAYYDACTVAAGLAGISDPGMRGPQRICRVPGSLHSSGYVAELIEADYSRVFALPELMAALGVDVQSVFDGRDNRVLGDGRIGLEAVQDTVADWLFDRGLATGRLREDWLEVRCPWADTHTDGREEAGYSPLDFGHAGRQFKCLHGHCLEKNTKMFLKWVAEQGGPVEQSMPSPVIEKTAREKVRAALGEMQLPPELVDEIEQEEQRDQQAEDFLHDLVYLENQGKWIQESAGAQAQYTAEGLQMVFGHLMPPSGRGPGKRARVADVWAARGNKRIVFDTSDVFSKPYGVIRDDGRLVFNTYKRFTPAAQFDVTCANRWSEHIMDTFGSDGVWLQKWLGWVAQNPARRVKWAPVLLGVQGDGKTILGAAMQTVIEPGRWVVTSTASVMSERNSYMDGARLVVIEEIRMSGVNRHAAMDKLKDLITNDRIEIREVYKKPRPARNNANIMAMTNHADALPLGRGDRRWAVFSSRFLTREEMLRERGAGTGYFDALWGDLHDRPEQVAGWLMSIDVSGFDPNAPAPHTDAKDEMSNEAKGELAQELEDLLSDPKVEYISDGVFLTSSILLRLKIESIRNAGLVSALRDLGWRPLPDPIRVGERKGRGWYKPAMFPEVAAGRLTRVAEHLKRHNEGLKT